MRSTPLQIIMARGISLLLIDSRQLQVALFDPLHKSLRRTRNGDWRNAMLSRFFVFAKKFQRDEGGAVLVYVALLMVSLLGMAGLAVEVGSLYDTRQQMQTAADAAAFSSAIAQCSGQTNGDNVVTEGRAAAASSGFVDDENAAVAISPYTPPDTKAGTEAIITRGVAGTLSRIFNIVNWNLGARAAAGCKEINFCMLALANTGTGLDVGGGGGGTIGNEDCGIYVNSTTTLQGNAKIAGPLTAAGDIQEIGNSVDYLYQKAPFPSENTGVIKEDPYGSLNLQSVVDTAVGLIPSDSSSPPLSADYPNTCGTKGATTTDVPKGASLSGGGDYCSTLGSATFGTGAKAYRLTDVSNPGDLIMSISTVGVYPTKTVTLVGPLTLGSANLVFREQNKLNSANLDTTGKLDLTGSLLVIYGNLTLKSGTELTATDSTVIALGNIDFQGGSEAKFTNSKLIMCPPLKDISGKATDSCPKSPAAKLSVGANAKVVFTTSTVYDYKDLEIQGGANVTFNGPTSGLAGGLALVNLGQTDYTWDLGGNVALTGAVYYPNGTVKFSGSATSTCGQVIARKIETQGTPSVNLENDGTCGLAKLTDAGPVQMLE